MPKSKPSERCPKCFRPAERDMPTVVQGLGATVRTCHHFPDCKPPEQPPEVSASHCERCQHHYAAHAGSNESCTIAGCDCSQYWLPEVPAPEEVWLVVSCDGELRSSFVDELEAKDYRRMSERIVRYIRSRS
jgi:hypothetical protein